MSLGVMTSSYVFPSACIVNVFRSPSERSSSPESIRTTSTFVNDDWRSFLRSAPCARAEIATSVVKTKNENRRAQKLLAFIRESFLRKVLSKRPGRSSLVEDSPDY